MILTARRYKLSRFGHVRCEPNWSLDESFSRHLTDCDLWYVWDGQGKMQLRHEEIDLHTGVCLWMRPGGQYLAQHDPRHPLGVTFLHFTAMNEQGRPVSHDALPREKFRVRDPRFFGTTTNEIVRLLRQGGNSVQPAHWLFQALIHDLLNGVDAAEAGAIGHHRAKIESQVARIYEQPSQTPKVSELAQAAALSTDHYGRIFKLVTGHSPRALIQKARLERACQLLHETALSITEIADQCGYADVFQFSRMFKRAMQVSPSQWRR